MNSAPETRFATTASNISDTIERFPGPLFALIIGINKYPQLTARNMKPLQGAVPDAYAVKEFLQTHLHVSSDHIKLLIDDAATRDKIIEELRDNFPNDDRIQIGDPILIYYAGHGSRLSPKTPHVWDTSVIETIVPYDLNDLHDRTIGELLNNLAAKKGNNITVVFDCCHSGSGTRASEHVASPLIRGVDPPQTLTDTHDIPPIVVDNRGALVPASAAHTALRSHVLLSACGKDELAREADGRGLYTQALLGEFERGELGQITYTELIHQLPVISGQHPQCEGLHQDRLLFKTTTPKRRRAVYAVRHVDHQYIMDAGAASGITEQSQFALYSSEQVHRFPLPAPICTLVAESVKAFSTLLRLSGPAQAAIPSDAFALQVGAGPSGDLRVFVSPSDDISQPLRHALIQGLEDRLLGDSERIVVLSDKGDAELGITLRENHVTFEILDAAEASSYGLQRVPFEVLFYGTQSSVAKFYSVMGATARYFWHLRHVPSNRKIHADIRIDFRQLEYTGEITDDLVRVCRLLGDNLNQDGVVELTIDLEVETMYGITITNESNLALYPYLFFFDNSDFSITSYFQPPTARDNMVDPPLSPGQSLAIGYGSGGGIPYSAYLREGQDIDVGFLKLFLLTKRADLSAIAQASAFSFEDRVGRKAIDTPELWDTITIPIVQRRQ